MEETIENKVSKSGLITLSLADFISKGDRVSFDIQPLLWKGMALKEKDFREFVATHDWTSFSGKNVAIHCSTDAIIPSWAYLLISVALQPYANKIVFGSIADLERELYSDVVNNIDISEYTDKRVLVKGCGNAPIPEVGFMMLSNKLLPVVKSLMFGEACSNVPLYKKK